jgi:hypothetical protein
MVNASDTLIWTILFLALFTFESMIFLSENLVHFCRLIHPHKFRLTNHLDKLSLLLKTSSIMDTFWLELLKV